MSGIFDRRLTLSKPRRAVIQSGNPWGDGPRDPPGFAARRVALLRGLCVAALAVAGFVLLLSALKTDSEAVVQLERLSSRIVRAQTLPPETREAIDRLIVRQRTLVGTGDPEKETRRQAAIDRVTSAIQAKDDSTAGGNTGRRVPN